MTLNRLPLFLFGASLVALPSLAQNAAPAQPSTVRKDPVRADAYYHFTMGHIFEQQYEQTGAGEYATRAIDSYKKALADDRRERVVGVRLLVRVDRAGGVFAGAGMFGALLENGGHGWVGVSGVAKGI